MEAALASDRTTLPLVSAVTAALEAAVTVIGERLGGFEAALAADREAGEHVSRELRACAQQEATLHAGLGTRTRP